MGRSDFVIRGGTLADGTGSPLREVDIAIADGRIAEIGAVSGSGREEIAAREASLSRPASSTSTPITTGRRYGSRVLRPRVGMASRPR